MRQLHMYSRPESCSKVRRTSQDISQMLIPHKLVSLALNEPFNFVQAATETIKHRPHVSSLLHRNDTRVILLVYPNKEVLVVVVPDSARVRPVTCHSRAREKRGHWFIEQEVIVNQLLLLGRGHTVQRKIAPRQVTCKQK